MWRSGKALLIRNRRYLREGLKEVWEKNTWLVVGEESGVVRGVPGKGGRGNQR